MRLFSGDISVAQVADASLWMGDRSNVERTQGDARSIYGTEYTDQCPFRTGNGYGDGRAVSVFEGCFKGRARWEMRKQSQKRQRTPYCRGGDGRTVLRSNAFSERV